MRFCGTIYIYFLFRNWDFDQATLMYLSEGNEAMDFCTVALQPAGDASAG